MKFVSLFLASAAATEVGKDRPQGLIFKDQLEVDNQLKRNAEFRAKWALDGGYASNAQVSHEITECDQQCSNWCWATSATMCASVFGGGDQCNAEEAQVAGHEFKTTCDLSCSSECDNGGSTDMIADAIEFLSGHKYTTGGVLGQDEMDAALANGPVVLGVYWSLGGGHAITISGVSNGQYHGHDPEGYSIDCDYSGLLTYEPPYATGQYTGQWAQTVYTESASALAADVEVGKNRPQGLIFKDHVDVDNQLKRNAEFEAKFSMDGGYASNAQVTHAITECDQKCSNWCWATSATMCASVFGGGDQCNAEEADVAGHEFKTTCDLSCSTECDQGGTIDMIVDAIQYLSGHAYTNAGVLDQDELDVALANGPIVLAVYWTLGGGHAITINGVSNGKYQGHDPEGYKIDCDYAGLLTYKPPYADGYTGKWTYTVYTESAQVLV